MLPNGAPGEMGLPGCRRDLSCTIQPQTQSRWLCLQNDHLPLAVDPDLPPIHSPSRSAPPPALFKALMAEQIEILVLPPWGRIKSKPGRLRSRTRLPASPEATSATAGVPPFFSAPLPRFFVWSSPHSCWGWGGDGGKPMTRGTGRPRACTDLPEPVTAGGVLRE